MLRFRILSLFPQAFEGFLNSSILGKARSRGLVDLEVIQIRDYSQDKHRTVDDSPYGGGEGMVLRADILHAAWTDVRAKLVTLGCPSPQTILLSPQGITWNQALAKEWASAGDGSSWILFCGHYEGVDQRFIDLCVDQEISIGDYVLTGGELPAAVVTETVVRLIPRVVGNSDSISKDSFEENSLKHPVYTKPRVFEGLKVPELLLGGDHRAINEWRKSERARVTSKKRPDLKS